MPNTYLPVSETWQQYAPILLEDHYELIEPMLNNRISIVCELAPNTASRTITGITPPLASHWGLQWHCPRPADAAPSGMLRKGLHEPLGVRGKLIDPPFPAG